MKIADVDVTKRETGDFTIWRDGRAITLKVSPLPLNFETRVKSAIPLPEPRTEFAREKGRILRDAAGNAVRVLCEQDPAFQSARERVADLRLCVLAAEALRHDESVTFDTPRPNPPWGNRQYAEALEKEFLAAEWTDGELAGVINASVLCSVYDVDQEAERFLPVPPPAQAGGCPTTPDAPSTT